MDFIYYIGELIFGLQLLKPIKNWLKKKKTFINKSDLFINVLALIIFFIGTYISVVILINLIGI